MTALRTFFATSPALVVGAVSAVLGVLVAFQLPITDQQNQAIAAAVLAVFVLGASLVTHGSTISRSSSDTIVRTMLAGPPPVDPTPAAIDPGGQGA